MPPPNKKPVAVLVIPEKSKVSEAVELDMTGSNSPSGFIQSWQLEFGNGDVLTGDGQPDKASYIWDNDGDYSVTLSVTDNKRHQARDVKKIRVEDVVKPDPEPVPDPLVIEAIEDVSQIVEQGDIPVPYPEVIVTGGVNPTVAYEPPEGTFFPLGETTVTVRANSEDGQQAQSSFTVTLVQVLKISATAPEPVDSETEPVAVSFTVSVSGGVEPVTITQVPEGNSFMFGTTTVTVSAASADGQGAQTSFDVVVNQIIHQATEDTYFTRMAARPDFATGCQLNSQEQISGMKPPQKPANYPGLTYEGGYYPASEPYDPTKATQKKRPAVYDAVEKAAYFETRPDVTTDTQQLYFQLANYQVGDTIVLVQDMKLDENWCWRRGVVEQYGEEYFNRLKAQQMRGPNNGAWSTRRTFFDHAYQENSKNQFSTSWVAEWVGTSNSATRMLPPLSWTENEMIYPRVGEPFFVEPNVWAREVVKLKYAGLLREWTQSPLSAAQQAKIALPPTDKDSWYGAHVVLMSVWYSDEKREARQTLVDVPIVLEYVQQLNVYAMENDTGQDKVRPTFKDGVMTNPGDNRIRAMWMRNFLHFINPNEETFNEILEKPLPTIVEP